MQLIGQIDRYRRGAASAADGQDRRHKAVRRERRRSVGDQALEYASQFTANPSELMVERLDIAAQEYIAGLGISETEKHQTQMLKEITKPGAAWELSGWRPGMLGALTMQPRHSLAVERSGHLAVTGQVVGQHVGRPRHPGVALVSLAHLLVIHDPDA